MTIQIKRENIDYSCTCKVNKQQKTIKTGKRRFKERYYYIYFYACLNCLLISKAKVKPNNLKYKIVNLYRVCA